MQLGLKIIILYALSSLLTACMEEEASVDIAPDLGLDNTKSIYLNLPAVEDSYILKSSPNESFESTTNLISKNSNSETDAASKILLKFDISSIPQKDIKADLNIFYTLENQNNTSENISIIHSDPSWNGNELTWNTHPSEFETAITQEIQATNTFSWLNISVDSLIQKAVNEGDAVISLYINNPNTSVLALRSREYHNTTFTPQLLVTYQGNLIDQSISEIENDTSNDQDSNDQSSNDQSSNDQEDTNAPVQLASGEELYKSQCRGCHGNTGDGVSNGSSILDSVISGTASAIIQTTMPIGNPSECGTDCATDIVYWLKNLHGLFDTEKKDEPSQDNTENEDDSNTVDSVSSNLKVLHKTVLNMVNRIPTNAEISEVKTNGKPGLRSVVEDLVNDSIFLNRIYEIYEPLFPYATPINPRRANLLYSTQFDNSGSTKRYQEISDTDLSDYVDEEGIKSYGYEALQLIKYIVKNNLPFTEILTADYTVLNYFGAYAFGYEDQVNWKTLSNPDFPDFPYDTDDYRKITLDLPHAGVLSTAGFMQAYPTTETNVGRHRAYNVFLHFLGVDILDIPGTRITTDVSHEFPTMTDPACTGCHILMDPVSSSFSNWQKGMRYSNTAQNWDFENILPAGFNGESRPSNAERSPLQWLANEIAQDRRFASSTVKLLVPEMSGHQLITGLSLTEENTTTYASEQNLINELTDSFIASGYDIKSLIVNIVSSDFNYDKTYLGGTSSLIPAARLSRKHLATIDTEWTTNGTPLIVSGNHYGPAFNTRQPNGLTTSALDLVASKLSCTALAIDLSKATPILLPNITYSESIFNQDGTIDENEKNRIKETLKNLYWRLWGQAVELDDARVENDYNHYIEFVTLGQAEVENGGAGRNLDAACRPDDINSDHYFLLRGWILILNMMLSDHEFIYE